MHRDHVRQLDLFRHCPRREIARIAAGLTDLYAPVGATVVRQGEPGYEFFVIVDGRARVVVDRQPIAELVAGDYFGEIALLDNELRTASVIAETELHLAVSSVPEFVTIISSSPVLTRRLLAGSASRLRSTLLHGQTARD